MIGRTCMSVIVQFLELSQKKDKWLCLLRLIMEKSHSWLQALRGLSCMEWGSTHCNFKVQPKHLYIFWRRKENWQKSKLIRQHPRVITRRILILCQADFLVLICRSPKAGRFAGSGRDGSPTGTPGNPIRRPGPERRRHRHVSGNPSAREG